MPSEEQVTADQQASMNPVVTGSTGRNDSGGIYSLLNTVLTQGVQTYRSLSNGDQTSTARPSTSSTVAASSSSSSWKKYLPWAIGAVALLVVLGFVLRRK